MDLQRTVAEEVIEEKANVHQDRVRKFTKDRKPKHGDQKFAQTEGLKLVRKPINKPLIITDDEYGEIDLTRVRSLKDFQA